MSRKACPLLFFLKLCNAEAQEVENRLCNYLEISSHLGAFPRS